MENRIEYKQFVHSLVKPGTAIVASLTPAKADMWHAVTGIVGEAGELLDSIKKTVVYNKEVDRENIVEELGDIEFYMEQLRQRTGITREETIRYNMKKLSVRYSGGYTDQKAQERVDKIIQDDGEISRAHTCIRSKEDDRCIFCNKIMAPPKLVECPTCHGEGDLYDSNSIGERPCPNCKGAGRVQQ